MPSQRKFYRTVFTYELLTEEHVGHPSLEEIAYEAREGHGSGMFLETKLEVIDGPTAARLLQNQGSDTEFFRLTEDGEDLEEL